MLCLPLVALGPLKMRLIVRVNSYDLLEWLPGHTILVFEMMAQCKGFLSSVPHM